MKQQPVVRIAHESFRNDGDQPFFDFQYGFSWRQIRAVRDPEDMGVDSHCILAESGVQYDVGCFSTDTGKGFERGTVGRHFTILRDFVGYRLMVFT